VAVSFTNMNILRRILLFTSILLLTACNLGATTPDAATASPTQTLPTPQESTPTAAANAASVDGETISMAAYERSLTQYQAAQAESGTLLASEGIEQIVLDDLIARLLMAQGARNEGFTADDAQVAERLTSLTEEAGGQTALNQYLALEMEAGWMRQQITDAVPTSAEQVEARQVLLSDDFSAERLLGQLESGTSFDTIVANNDPQHSGYLGWFPRGYLLQPEVEEAAFALQPGEYSQVIETELGFHLIEVLNRDPERPLNPQARLALQIKALEDWVAQQRAQSDIEVFLP
jgi:peptidyl-prolyl cis-trans isomerase C